MTKRVLIEAAIVLVFLASVFFTGYGVGFHVRQKETAVTSGQANNAKEKAQNEAVAGALQDAQADIAKQSVAQADAKAHASSKVLVKKLETLPSIPAGDDKLVATEAALSQAQTVIADQKAQIEARDQLIASLTKARDFWKLSAEDAQQAMRLQQIATEGREAAQAKRTFWGELRVGASAALLGYAAGRAHH